MRQVSIVLFFWVVYFTSLTTSNIYATPTVDTNYANQLVDMLLTSLQTTYSKTLDPLTIPNLTESFSTSVFGLQITAQVNFTNGQMFGASKVYRVGDAHLGPLAQSGELSGSVGLGLNNTRVNATIGFKLNRFKIERKGTLRLLVKSMKMNVQGYLSSSTLKPVLKDMKLTQLEGFQVHLSGLGIVGDLLQNLSSLIVKYFNKRIIAILEAQMKLALKSAFI